MVRVTGQIFFFWCCVSKNPRHWPSSSRKSVLDWIAVLRHECQIHNVILVHAFEAQKKLYPWSVLLALFWIWNCHLVRWGLSGKCSTAPKLVWCCTVAETPVSPYMNISCPWLHSMMTAVSNIHTGNISACVPVIMIQCAKCGTVPEVAGPSFRWTLISPQSEIVWFRRCTCDLLLVNCCETPCNAVKLISHQNTSLKDVL